MQSSIVAPQGLLTACSDGDGGGKNGLNTSPAESALDFHSTGTAIASGSSESSRHSLSQEYQHLTGVKRPRDDDDVERRLQRPSQRSRSGSDSDDESAQTELLHAATVDNGSSVITPSARVAHATVPEAPSHQDVVTGQLPLSLRAESVCRGLGGCLAELLKLVPKLEPLIKDSSIVVSNLVEESAVRSKKLRDKEAECLESKRSEGELTTRLNVQYYRIQELTVQLRAAEEAAASVDEHREQISELEESVNNERERADMLADRVRKYQRLFEVAAQQRDAARSGEEVVKRKLAKVQQAADQVQAELTRRLDEADAEAEQRVYAVRERWENEVDSLRRQLQEAEAKNDSREQVLVVKRDAYIAMELEVMRLKAQLAATSTGSCDSV